MLRIYLAFLLIGMHCNYLFSQQVLISGEVIDSLDAKPLNGASLSFYRNDGRIVSSLLTDSGGRFVVALDSGLLKSVSVSFTGFKSKIVGLSFKKLSTEHDLGKIFLLPDVASLDQIIVQGKRAPVSFRVDRQVYKAAQFANAIGGAGTDLIKNLPSVSVNGEGRILLRGSESFLLLLNGKPVLGDQASVLSQLPAATIESIELITSPSAIYDADGKTGIINIVTKSGAEDGWMLQSTVMGGMPPVNDFNNQHFPVRHSIELSTGFKKNKWDVNGNLNYLRNDIAGFREGDVYTIIGDTKTRFPSAGERSFRRFNYGGRIAAAYEIDKANSISTAAFLSKKFQRRVADLQYDITRQSLSSGQQSRFSYFNENTQEKQGVFGLASIDYAHKFSPASRLNFSILYEHAALEGTTYNNNIRMRGSTDTLQYTINPSSNPLNAFRLKADYSTKIFEGEMQAGYQYRRDIQNGDFIYLTKISGTDRFETDPDFTSRVGTANTVQAAYLQFNSAIRKISYSAGLRLEQTNRKIEFSKVLDDKTLRLLNLFPSVQLRYRNGSTTYKLAYNKRIKRTNNFELNPFPEREHSETLEQGDPALLPELISTAELGVEKNLSTGSFFATLYYQQTRNPIQRVNKVFNDTILNRVFTNSGFLHQYGVETNLTLQIGRFWQSTVGGNFYHYSIKGKIFGGLIPVNNSAWVFSVNTNQTFTIQKNYSLQLSVSYLSRRATAQGEDGAFLVPNLTAKRATKDGRWSFQVQWLNMDAGLKISNRQRITTQGIDFFTTTNYIYEPDQIQASVIFNIVKRNRKINLPVSEFGEKEF